MIVWCCIFSDLSYSTTQASTLAFRTTNTPAVPKRTSSAKGLGRFGLSSTPNSGTGLGAMGLSKLEMEDGVHVQMETFESPTSDYPSKADDFPHTPTDDRISEMHPEVPYTQYDAMGNVLRSRVENYDDLESQRIRGEFKQPPY